MKQHKWGLADLSIIQIRKINTGKASAFLQENLSYICLLLFGQLILESYKCSPASYLLFALFVTLYRVFAHLVSLHKMNSLWPADCRKCATKSLTKTEHLLPKSQLGEE